MDTKTLQKLFFFSVCFIFILFHYHPGHAQWLKVTVDTGDVGWYTSIALDDSENPRISYHEGTSEDLLYTWCDGACTNALNWSSETVDSSGDVGRHSSLYDSSGNPHISYYDETTVDDGDLKYAYHDGIDWQTETVDGGNCSVAETQCADSSDCSPGEDCIGDVGLDTSLSLDGSGNPHISYFDVDNLNLKYAYKSAGTWQIVTVDDLGTVGEFTSLALDGSGNPRISYHGNSTLKYAWCDTGCATAGNWTAITVDNSVGDVGEYTSLSLDSSGNPRISYKDATNNDLKYALCTTGCDDPNNWTTITPDRAGNTGWNTSLALTTADNPRIAYYKFDTGDLQYAWCDVACANTTNWTTETVDSAGDVGDFCSLALNTVNNTPHISYYDFANEDLKYATLPLTCEFDEDCNDFNPCTNDSCNTSTSACEFTPNSDACNDGLFCTETDQCSGGSCLGSGDPCTPQACDEETDTCVDDTDSDGDGISDLEDNCLETPNGPNLGTCTSGTTGTTCVVDGECGSGGFCSTNQEDTYPPDGNGIGDACDCEADFNCDGNVDATEVDAFLADFGRSTFFEPCTNADPCNGDFDCNVSVDALDVSKFLEDFGRSIFNNPCPACVAGDWCVY
jgi:hypothetical protein